MPYKKLVGNLMYAMVVTRPDFFNVANIINQFMLNPSREHWLVVKRILCTFKEHKIYGYNIEEMKRE